jgi:hypothetical protein
MPRFWRNPVGRVLVLLLLSFSAAAFELGTLYTGVVPVEDQNEPARKKAEAAALAQVLVKLSGSSELLKQELVRQQMSAAGRYIQRYQYLMAAKTPEEAPQLWLEAVFDAKAVERLIQQVAAPLWGKRRPLTLFWVVESDASGRHLLSSDKERVLASEIERAGVDRGLPVLLPLLDLEETSQVDLSDVWGRFLEPLQKLSTRYAPDAIVVGRIEQTGQGWNGELSLAHGSFRENFSATGTARFAVVDQLMARLAAFYAGKYAVVIDTSKEARQWIQVRQVNTVEDYGRVVGLLGALQSVRGLEVTRASAGELLLNVQLVTEQDAFLRAVALDGRLQPVAESGAEAGASDTLVFDWQAR